MDGSTIAIIALSVSIGAALFTHFRTVSALGERVARLETQMAPFWRIFQDRAVDMLKSPGHESKDLLLEKLRHGTIKLEEIEDLKCILSNDFEHSQDSGKRAIYVLFLGRLEGLIEEQRRNGKGKGK